MLTTSRFVEGERFSRAEDEAYWYWGWWWIDRTEIWDEQVNLYADYLPQGSLFYLFASLPKAYNLTQSPMKT